MVSPEYVEYLVEVANEKMGVNRKRTDLFLIKLINNSFAGHEIRMNGEMSSDPAETLAEVNKLDFWGILWRMEWRTWRQSWVLKANISITSMMVIDTHKLLSCLRFVSWV
ncbi:UNVERIFIED_CONTAM: tRNA wybutosine-synthesizing protein 2/3/4 [Sesamum radiatum]|uniref:tRNA wybutosine-synthesizing protein 2/3/4 n=1 Tax=Sesamum radiatum TaxID=300843 RepID=A0AAW2T345_SESRA